MKTCPSCNAANAVDAKYCTRCMLPLPRGAKRTCPAGHSMEAHWTECRYCQQLGGAPSGPVPPGNSGGRDATVIESPQSGSTSGSRGIKTPTRPEDQPLAPRVTVRPFSNTPSPRSDRPATGPETPQRRQTNYYPEKPSPPPAGSPPALARRKIVGILVSYSWKPDGEIFPLREGRNIIGRDVSCDVCVAMDQTLSERNTHITFRNNFVIGDLVSMKGTDLNGEPIEEQFHSLPNYATIRAGSTYFTFIAIQPPAEHFG
jgi:hypothetical protein